MNQGKENAYIVYVKSFLIKLFLAFSTKKS